MVADSKSSLRRRKLRGHHSSSRQSSADIEDKLPRPQPELNPRSKRARASTLSEKEQEQKRRKLAKNHNHPQLRIPLRGRKSLPEIVTPKVVPQAVSVPETLPRVSQIHKILDSPTAKPQYDQIKIIEEKARAAIRESGSETASPDDRRKLRSEHGASRSKTELAQYFPMFEEMLALEHPDPETLTAKTKVILYDDTPDYQPPPVRSDPFGAHKPLHNTDFMRLSVPPKIVHQGSSDPLDAEIYLKIHRKAERHEKQMKNGDRERAQHEKYQLEKLLDDLRGPDWLKTLGISGITDTEKKRYEPKRILFIRETKALIDKFKWWKEEEKRRKLEKEQAMLEDAAEEEEEEEEEEDDDDEGTDDDAAEEEEGDDEEEDEVDETASVSSTSSQAPDSSEIDALASQQLLQEAKSASKRKKVIAPLEPEPPPYKPFTSFFSKRHIRDAAITGRQRGRTVLAFGQPIPDVQEQEYELPDEILTEDAIRASQRSRRRLRRSIHDTD